MATDSTPGDEREVIHSGKLRMIRHRPNSPLGDDGDHLDDTLRVRPFRVLPTYPSNACECSTILTMNFGEDVNAEVKIRILYSTVESLNRERVFVSANT